MIKRIIRWEVNGTQYARGFIFGNYGWSVADYAKLVKQAKQDFPSLTDDNIEPVQGGFVPAETNAGTPRLRRLQ